MKRSLVATHLGSEYDRGSESDRGSECASRNIAPDPKASASLKRDYASCSTQSNLEACYDAIRWNPSDPALLMATETR
jgi:hypothetical protein